MRCLALAACLLATTVTVEARPRHRAVHAKQQVARTRDHLLSMGELRGQSIGQPWAGLLHDAAKLPDGDGYVIRRPWRSYGTRETVDHVLQTITDWRERYPDAHVLAIGDISAEHGGRITDHHSHQSGRDADIGLIYKEQPDGYPNSFVDATEDNLDAEATFALLEGFAATRTEDGGAQMVFLDYNVQGILYRWARDHGVDETVLGLLFQYPRGKGADAFCHHEPNHQNHMHVRFGCPKSDPACR